MTALAIALSTLAGSAVSIAAVHAAGGPLRRRFGPRHAYACWALPWCSVATSLLPATGITTRPFAWSGNVTRRLVAYLPIDYAEGVAVLAIWATLSIAFLASHLAVYFAFMRRASQSAVLTADAVRVDVFRSPGVTVPLAAGIFRRRIYVPLDFDRVFLPQERTMALRHEEAHHERHDVLANLSALVLLSLHWWNPLAHRAHRRFRADQEMACDARATTGLDPVARQAYGMAILKCARSRGAGLAAALSGRDELAARLRAIASPADARRVSRRVAITTLVGLAAISLVDGIGPRGIATLASPIAPPTIGTATVAPDADAGGRWTGLCDEGDRRTPDPVALVPAPARPAWTDRNRLTLAALPIAVVPTG